MTNFQPVRSLEELAELDQAEVVEGYLSAERGDPEPGPNRGRAFWHGWRNRMIDLGQIPGDDASRQLAAQYVALSRGLKADAAKAPLWAWPEIRARAKAEPGWRCADCPGPYSLGCMCRTEGAPDGV